MSLRKFTTEDYHRMIAASCGSAAGNIIGHPIDSLKVRMQVSGTKHNAFRMIYSIVKNEGLLVFFRGFFPPTFMKSITWSMFFTMNGYIVSVLTEKERNRLELIHGSPQEKVVLPIWKLSMVAGLCGMALTPFQGPAEFIKVQLQTDKNLGGIKGSRKFNGMFDCIKQAWKHNSLYRGTIATTLRMAPSWASYIFIYDHINRYFDKFATLGSNEVLSGFGTTFRVLIAGGTAGSLSWIVCYPFDYLKTQIQAHPMSKWNYIGTIERTTRPLRMADIAELTIKRFGIPGFYRGLGPTVVRAWPVNVNSIIHSLL